MGYNLANHMGTSGFAIQQAVITLCTDQDGVSVEQIAGKIGCSERTVKRNLHVALEAGAIIRHPKKAGHFTCNKTVRVNR